MRVGAEPAAVVVCAGDPVQLRTGRRAAHGPFSHVVRPHPLLSSRLLGRSRLAGDSRGHLGQRVQTKLEAVFGAPVRYLGQVGYSQSGRVRLWLASVTVGLLGGCPFSTQCSSAVRESQLAANAGVPKFAWFAPGTA